MSTLDVAYSTASLGEIRKHKTQILFAYSYFQSHHRLQNLPTSQLQSLNQRDKNSDVALFEGDRGKRHRTVFEHLEHAAGHAG